MDERRRENPVGADLLHQCPAIHEYQTIRRPWPPIDPLAPRVILFALNCEADAKLGRTAVTPLSGGPKTTARSRGGYAGNGRLAGQIDSEVPPTL